jgi:hypothetical protein
LQLFENLSPQFSQANLNAILFANFYNLEVCLDVDDFEVPTSINGSCDWSPCSQFDVAITNCNAPPTFDCQSLVDEVCPKYQFLDVDERELENVDKGGCRASKHVELWAKNAFDGWRKFHGCDTEKSITNLS